MACSTSVEVPVFWMLVKDWERVCKRTKSELFLAMTGQRGVEVAGYYLPDTESTRAHIVIFPSIIYKWRNHPACPMSVYQSSWAPLVHTLLHELCHDEKVEDELTTLHPGKDPHGLIDLWVAKTLAWLEINEDEKLWMELILSNSRKRALATSTSR